MTENPNRPHRPAGSVRARARELPPWVLVAAGVLLGGLTGGTYGELRTPEYTATGYVVAVPTDRSDPAAATGFAQAYGRVATQLAVLGDAQVWAGVPVSVLRGSVRATTSPDAPMIAVSASSSRPDLAADIANAVTRSLTQHADETRSSTHVKLVQFSRAVEPATPSSPSALVTSLVGVGAGGLLGGLAVLVRPRRSPEEPHRQASVPSPATAADVHGQL